MTAQKIITEIQSRLNLLVDMGYPSTLLVTWNGGALLKIDGACSALAQPEGNAEPLSAHLSA